MTSSRPWPSPGPDASTTPRPDIVCLPRTRTTSVRRESLGEAERVVDGEGLSRRRGARLDRRWQRPRDASGPRPAASARRAPGSIGAGGKATGYVPGSRPQRLGEGRGAVGCDEGRGDVRRAYDLVRERLPLAEAVAVRRDHRLAAAARRRRSRRTSASGRHARGSEGGFSKLPVERQRDEPPRRGGPR